MKSIHFISSPIKTIQGELKVPGDKSISHRSIIFGSIAQGTTTIQGFLDGEDCLATLNAFRAMGVNIEGPHEQQLTIHGVGKYGLKKPTSIIDCGNSGTSIRLLAGLLAAQPFASELTGDSSLLKRPMMRVAKPLAAMGAYIETSQGTPPLKIKGGQTLTGINYDMPEVSAQVKSCILLAGLYAQGKTTVTEKGISRNHTELMLKSFGYPVILENNTITVDSTSECKATNLTIPGDISSAAFFIVAATIIPNANLILRGVGINPTRMGIIPLLKKMGANINLLNLRKSGEEEVADIHVQHAPLQGIEIPEKYVALAIDEFPILFIAAACAEGETILHGAKELRVKESDRIGVMAEGLTRLGIENTCFEDGILIRGGTLQGGEVESHGDHRIAMSFAIAGAVAKAPIKIFDCANVATSFPGFVRSANSLHFSIKEVVDNV